MTSSSLAAPSAAVPAFHTKDLTKTYQTGDTRVHALRGVNLSIDPGEMVVLLGPSGSGKSTLLNILGGLDKPTSGTAHFRDLDLTEIGERALTAYRRNFVGFIFQFYNLMPSLTALENVELVTEIADDPMPAEEALSLVGLGDRLHHFPSQLSGGQQQRVAVARAVAKRPEILLCDEPTGALDSQTGIQVLEALQHVNETLDTTTLIITHNAGIAGIADRVLHFADGTIARTQTNSDKCEAKDLSW